MTLDRSWVRRALVSPAPWGKSVPDVWAETQVTFIRRGTVPDNIGGFSGTAETTHGPFAASVSIATDSGLHIDLTSGPVRRRHYLVIIDYAKLAAVAFTPSKGDRLRFTDKRGQTVTINVKSADLPEGIADHWEIESEEFE